MQLTCVLLAIAAGSSGHPGYNGHANKYHTRVSDVADWTGADGALGRQGGGRPVFAQPNEDALARAVCPVSRLPGEFFSSPQLTTHWSSAWSRKGFWETHDGGALAAWSQTVYGQDTEIDITIDDKVLAHLKVTPMDIDGAVWTPGKDTQIMIEDCAGRALYRIQEGGSLSVPLEVYDAKTNVLLAKATMGAILTDTLQWVDGSKEANTIAMAKRKVLPDDINDFGGIMHFSMDYVTGVNAVKDHSLTAIQNRWVLAAATQIRAIREADRDEAGLVQAGPFIFWMSTWHAFKWVVLAAFVISALWFSYVWIYFPDFLKSLKDSFVNNTRKKMVTMWVVELNGQNLGLQTDGGRTAVHYSSPDSEIQYYAQLGLQTEASGNDLRVTRVRKDGLVAEWNTQDRNRNNQVKPGDTIIKVIATAAGNRKVVVDDARGKLPPMESGAEPVFTRFGNLDKDNSGVGGKRMQDAISQASTRIMLTIKRTPSSGVPSYGSIGDYGYWKPSAEEVYARDDLGPSDPQWPKLSKAELGPEVVENP